VFEIVSGAAEMGTVYTFSFESGKAVNNVGTSYPLGPAFHIEKSVWRKVDIRYIFITGHS
jgi:hypothetical protein